MCLIIGPFSRKKIAKEDIVCYKLGFLQSDSNNYDIVRFHPMIYTEYAYDLNYIQPKVSLVKAPYANLFFGLKKFAIENGYHSYKQKPGYTTYVTQEIFIIPKGTAYYENKTQYVSETIKWIR